VPVRDIDGEMYSLQFITLDGAKQFLSGGRKKGCFCILTSSSNLDVIYVTGGWATGCSVKQSIGGNVVVCFDAGNLLPVCNALRGKYPDSKIIICADDDFNMDGNPSITKASEAVAEINGFVVKPEFGADRAVHETDFNDMH
jgi:putative DNA primase/helicase